MEESGVAADTLQIALINWVDSFDEKYSPVDLIFYPVCWCKFRPVVTSLWLAHGRAILSK